MDAESLPSAQQQAVMRDCVKVLDTAIDRLTMPQVLDLADAAIVEQRRLRIGVVNAAKLVNMKQDPELNSDVASSDIVLADGMSVVWASKLTARPLPERVAGIDLMHELLGRASSRQYGVFFFGAEEGVVQQVVSNARTDYPGMRIAGYRNGYFDEGDEMEIVEHINAATPDVLFVAMTSPKKERFMARWAETLTVPIIHGVGGSFDVYAGKVSRAPVWMQRSGLEWLHRVLQEPQRMWRRYLTTNCLFVWRVGTSMLNKKRS